MVAADLILPAIESVRGEVYSGMRGGRYLGGWDCPPQRSWGGGSPRSGETEGSVRDSVRASSTPPPRVPRGPPPQLRWGGRALEWCTFATSNYFLWSHITLAKISA